MVSQCSRGPREKSLCPFRKLREQKLFSQVTHRSPHSADHTAMAAPQSPLPPAAVTAGFRANHASFVLRKCKSRKNRQRIFSFTGHDLPLYQRIFRISLIVDIHSHIWTDIPHMLFEHHITSSGRNYQVSRSSRVILPIFSPR